MADLSLISRPRLVPYTRLLFDDVRQQYVLLLPEGALLLNQTAADVLQLCDGQRSIADITQQLRETYETVVPEDIVALIRRLVAKGVLQIDGES